MFYIPQVFIENDVVYEPLTFVSPFDTKSSDFDTKSSDFDTEDVESSDLFTKVAQLLSNLCEFQNHTLYCSEKL